MDPLELAKPDHLIITGRQWEEMRIDVERRAPEEACGLLAGVPGQAKLVLPITNELHSPVRFRMAAQEQLDAFERIDLAGFELVGIYHSHPNGPHQPSATDVAEAYYPEVVHLIWSPENGQWSCSAFSIQDGGIHEIRLNVRNL